MSRITMHGPFLGHEALQLLYSQDFHFFSEDNFQKIFHLQKNIQRKNITEDTRYIPMDIASLVLKLSSFHLPQYFNQLSTDIGLKNFLSTYQNTNSHFIKQLIRNYKSSFGLKYHDNDNNYVPRKYLDIIQPFIAKHQLGKHKYPQSPDVYYSDISLRQEHSSIIAQLFDYIWQTQPFERDIHYVDEPFGSTWHGVRRALQNIRNPIDLAKNYFKLVKITPPSALSSIIESSLQIVVPFFSYIKAFFHAIADYLPALWFLYVELDTLCGYPIDKNRKEGDDSKQWLNVDVHDLHSHDWWAQEVYNLLLQYSHISSEPLISFEEFVHRRWLWVTDGATPFSKLYLGEEQVKTKFGAAVSLTDQELLDTVSFAIAPHTENLTIFIKPDERGYKKRLIANMDLGSYLIAAYIRYLIQYLDGEVPKWMTATTNPQSDIQVIELIRQHNTAIPLDESQFDHHLSHAAWVGFLEALEQIFPNNTGVKLFRHLFDNTKFRYEKDNSITSWYKGMPSGLAITAIGNTLFNFIKQKSIFSPLHYALGDDALLFNNTVTLHQLEDYYNTFGSEVNPLKNWTSQLYAEYLHFLYTTRCRVGYPARMYGSLIWGLKFSDVSPIQRINELATSFKDFFDRAVLPIDEHIICADISRAVSRSWSGFKTSIARQWLHIPKVLGGFGLLPYIPKEFVVSNDKESVQRTFYTNSLFELPPKVQFTRSTFQLNNVKFTAGSYKTGPPLRMPPIETLQDWQDRLLYKNAGYSKVEQEYGFGLIPLPEIPGISISRVSSFASSYMFNAAPNLTGNIVHIKNRLIRASLGLAHLINQWRALHAVTVYV